MPVSCHSPVCTQRALPEQRLAIGKVARTGWWVSLSRDIPTQQLAPALDIDARLTEIERSLNLLLNVTPVNAAEAWADFERSDFGTVPILGSGRWNLSRTWCDVTSTTSRSRT
jgi:hypothetical protein